MEKKGVSTIIATVLIILMVLVAIILFWSGIFSTISQKITFSEVSGVTNIIISEGYTGYASNGDGTGNLSLQISQTDNDKITKIKIVIYTKGGNTLVEIINNSGDGFGIPGPNRKRVYSYEWNNPNIPEYVSLVPIYKEGNSEIEGGATRKVKIPQKDIIINDPLTFRECNYNSDCGAGEICDGSRSCAPAIECTIDSDCYSDNECTLNRCLNEVCDYSPRLSGDLCNGGAGVCDGSGSCVECFSGEGVILINPSNGSDNLHAIAIDNTGIYIVGFDSQNFSGQWRIEKRNLTTGAFVTAFGNNGVIVETSLNMAYANDIAVDNESVYIAGFDSELGNNNAQWRLEKRNKITGNLDNTFGANGVIVSDPSDGDDVIYSAVIDNSSIYIAGVDFELGNAQWRIEKRDLISGNLDNTFGTNGNGIVVSDYSDDNDSPYAIAIDSNSIYIAGVDFEPGNAQWHIEKYDKITGNLDNTFGVNGVIVSDPSDGDDIVKDVVINNSSIYIAGVDFEPGNAQWHIEKRDKITGNLDNTFGANGVIVSDPSDGDDMLNAINIEDSGLYAVGFDSQNSSGQWHIEKHNLTNGNLIPAFGNNGVIVETSLNMSYANDIIIDNEDIYIAGFDSEPGNAQWRLEKRNKINGMLAVGFPYIGNCSI